MHTLPSVLSVGKFISGCVFGNGHTVAKPKAFGFEFDNRAKLFALVFALMVKATNFINFLGSKTKLNQILRCIQIGKQALQDSVDARVGEEFLIVALIFLEFRAGRAVDDLLRDGCPVVFIDVVSELVNFGLIQVAYQGERSTLSPYKVE